jgi:signal transduction histidine kinase
MPSNLFDSNLNSLRYQKKWVWILFAAVTITQVFVKFRFDESLSRPSDQAFHLIWMAVLHLAITVIFVSRTAPSWAKGLLLFQLLVPLFLSFVLPRMHLTLLLSMPWIIMVKMKLLLSKDPFLKWFDINLAAYIVAALIGLFLFYGEHNGYESSHYTEYIFYELIATLSTFTLCVILFRRFLLMLKVEITDYREQAWYSQWYLTLMTHFSHNLRTPMAHVITNAEILGFLVLNQEKESAIVDRIKTGSNNLNKMINSLISASNINNLNPDGENVESVVKEFISSSKREVFYTETGTFNTVIKGPEIISLVLSLDAFVDNSYRYGATNVYLEIHESKIVLKDNGPGLSETLYKQIGNPHLNATRSGTGLSIHFMFKLLLESGWKVSITEWQTGVTYEFERILSGWAQKAIS